MRFLSILSAAVVSGLLLLCSCGTPDLPAPARPATSHEVMAPDGVSIRFDVCGEGEPALVFIHGWSCDRQYWDEQVPVFAAQHRVVAVDLGGHGESGTNRQDWTMQAFGADVAAVVNALGLTNVVLLGHSMGGAVAIEAARLLPGRVACIVGVDTLHDVEETITPQQITGYLAPLRADFPGAVRAMVRGDLFRTNARPELVSRIADDMAGAPPAVALGAIENLFRYDAGERMRKLNVPIRCIDCDLFPINTQAGQRHSISFQVVVMEGAGHFLMLEDPARFNRILKTVLQEFRATDGTGMP